MQKPKFSIMAGVLDALASYIKNMLMEMAVEEVDMLLGVSGEIDNMDIKLRDLKNILADADRRNITDQSVQPWAIELRNAMYDATDILDLCQLKALERGQRHDARCFNPLLFCIRSPLHAHDIGSRIKNLNKKLDDIKARGALFNFMNLGTYEDRGRNVVSYPSGTRETQGGLDESGLVDEKIEEDTTNLVEMLTKKYPTDDDKSNKIIIFSIVGIGGIGKTTLAQKIFNSEVIEHEFTKKIWLSVNQDFNNIEMLRRVIIEAGGNHHACGISKVALEQTLIEALKGHKTLLIMDDVWDYNIWEGVLRTPFVNAMLAQGSRVLVTTRHDIVARQMKAEEPYHRIDKLGLEDAWLLLKKQVTRDINDEPQIEILKDIGMRLVEKCDGLPLAVKVMGGLLRQKRIRRTDWHKVLDDSLWWMMSAAAESLRILTMEDLPCCMELPNGLCQLPSLELLQINRAPAIKRFGHEFQNPYHDRHNHSQQAAVGFPRLRELNFSGMTGWEEWEWEQNVHAMTVLEELLIKGCKLRRVPPGLSFSARALKKLYVYNVQHLRYLENFTSVVHIQVFESHDMERISNFPSLQKLEIIMCPKLKVLEGLTALQRLELEDYSMKTLPEYLMDVNPRYLCLWCNFSLLTSIATDFREWDKCIRKQQVKAYTSDGDIPCKWYVRYSRDPFNFETNITRSVIAHGLRDRTSELEALEHILAKTKKPCNLSLSLLKVITKNFSNTCKIGHGGCGEVYKGVLPNGGIVAVKRLFENYTMEDKMFGREVKSMMLVEHNNIVRFLGYCSDTQGHASSSQEGNFVIAEKRERLLCFEYINNGSLENHITDELRGSEWHTRYQIIKGICMGLDYLHNKKGIIHMDLKPPNILIDDHMVPKISDFGISRLDGKSQTMSTRLFSPGYSAPEYLFDGERSFKSDIYSLGMIIIETVTGSKENPNIAKVLRRWRHRWNKSSKYTPLGHQQVTKCLQLALRCRQQEPKHRPCILDIIRELDKVYTGGAQQIIDDTEFTSQQITQTFMNDMLGIEPLEIHIPSAPDMDISCSIELTNDTNNYIAFWIPINILRIPYFVRPDKGVIPPQSNCSVTITFQAQGKEPPHHHGKEFCVKSTLGHENLTSMDITEEMFNEEEPDKIVDEVHLSVRFDKPELVEER
ncbi:uncharacterized protein [Miscanthus floridulus]|uniref:uncharacterized protein n=1 Tax=Miscanthus floridulus TaxID=154761 RepID=UPI003457EC35